MKISKIPAVILAVAAGSMAQAGKAPALSYTYLEAAYISSDYADRDGGGANFTLSAEAAEHLYLFAGYSKISTDEKYTLGGNTGDICYKGKSIGIGAKTEVMKNTDAFISIAREKNETDLPARTRTNNTTNYALGARSRLTELVEVQAGIDHYLGDGDSTDTGYNIAARLHLNDDANVGIGYSEIPETERTEISVSVRWNF